jgi:hypothetical protein
MCELLAIAQFRCPSETIPLCYVSHKDNCICFNGVRGLPRDTIWPIEPHTAAKHQILRKYLDAWFPILATYNKRIVYVDGFAGPGRYTALRSDDAALPSPRRAMLRRRGVLTFLSGRMGSE